MIPRGLRRPVGMSPARHPSPVPPRDRNAAALAPTITDPARRSAPPIYVAVAGCTGRQSRSQRRLQANLHIGEIGLDRIRTSRGIVPRAAPRHNRCGIRPKAAARAGKKHVIASSSRQSGGSANTTVKAHAPATLQPQPLIMHRHCRITELTGKASIMDAPNTSLTVHGSISAWCWKRRKKRSVQNRRLFITHKQAGHRPHALFDIMDRNVKV